MLNFPFSTFIIIAVVIVIVIFKGVHSRVLFHIFIRLFSVFESADEHRVFLSPAMLVSGFGIQLFSSSSKRFRAALYISLTSKNLSASVMLSCACDFIHSFHFSFNHWGRYFPLILLLGYSKRFTQRVCDAIRLDHEDALHVGPREIFVYGYRIFKLHQCFHGFRILEILFREAVLL